MRNHFEIERMTACPRNIATVVVSQCLPVSPCCCPLSLPFNPFCSYFYPLWHWSAQNLQVMEMTMCLPQLLSSPTVIIKQPRHLPAWKTNKTKVSSYFGLFFYLLSFLPFYVKSPQQAGAEAVERGWGGHTHVSFVVRTNKHSRRTIRNLRKKAKVEEAAEEEGQLPVSQSELLFVARVRDLLNLWNYFTCISDSRSPHSLHPPTILVFVPSIWSIPAAVIVLFRRLISSGFTYHVAGQNFYATSYVAG